MERMSPKDQRGYIKVELQHYERIDETDLFEQRNAYIDLNSALAVAFSHDKEKSELYQNEANQMIKLARTQDNRATMQMDEDKNKEVKIPSQEDIADLSKMAEKNYFLAKSLKKELELMETEANLYIHIKKTSATKDNIDKIERIYVTIQDGSKDIGFGEIDSKRFQTNYPLACEKVQKTLSREYQKENEKNKNQGMGK